ncbi:DUF2318 domain-containing protein [Anaeromicropila herbilytica]|uniref:Membrane iron-sulfur containing protein FtrD-like domain-containing protein n=1 Tax=Anaeromicropila herbilytica TaxID=2785025 RepID=A0A7R7ENQ0_9FIRM|nr:DUF2318 domain-containing protein [Anaeromicropila herbilytica]BCN31951.1 hypothetical protein bsdtb5_32460 [Anaeromicropila herbilytica]
MNKKKTNYTNKKGEKKYIILKVTSGVILLVALLTVMVPQLSKNKQDTNKDKTVYSENTDTSKATQDEIDSQSTDTIDNETESTSIASIDNKDSLVIPIASVTDQVSFNPYNKLNNTMEVIAVKASDGTIRTAFNTCQVCNGSGRGYYKEENGVLTCQNCGNQFSVDDIGMIRGGCNPVPISDDEKKVTDTSIIISKATLKQYEGIFDNWKN